MSADREAVRPHARRPLLGAPLTERRPDSCADMADTPRGAARAGWTLLELVGALALSGFWVYLLWRVIDGLAS